MERDRRFFAIPPFLFLPSPESSPPSFLSEEHSFLFFILSLSLVLLGLLQRIQTDSPGFSSSITFSRFSSSLSLSSEGVAAGVESSDDDMVSFDSCGGGGVGLGVGL